MTLHERITAKIDELVGLAEAATPGPWLIERHSGWVVGQNASGTRALNVVRAAYGNADNDLIVTVASPEVVLRGLTEDRSILRRHAPCDDCPAHTVRMACHRCDLPVYRRGYGELGCEWQLSVARRHGIEGA